VPPRLRWFVWPILFVLFVVVGYALVRYQRAELVDFVVPRTAAGRFLAHEPLYRPDDGHYTHIGVGAVLIAACLARLRWRSVA
jgi:hypothetical protein